MKVLLIGGGGYLGITLSEYIQTNFDHLIEKLTVYDQFKYTNETFLDPNIEIIRDEIKNIDKYERKIKSYDIIYYLASPRLKELKNNVDVGISYTDLVKTLDVIDQENTKIIYISSCSVYGYQTDIVTEDTQVMVTSLYSRLKIMSENLVLSRNNPNHKIFRLSTLFGVGRHTRHDILINNIINDIKKTGSVKIYDLDAIRPHLCVKDAAMILGNLLIKFDQYDVITNVGKNKQNLTKRNIVKYLFNEMKLDFNVETEEVTDKRNYNVDFSKLNKINSFIESDFKEELNDLINENKVVCALEDWDTIIDYYRPNGSSKTWYLNEEEKLDIPKMWGEWNVFNKDNNDSVFGKSRLSGLVVPITYQNNVVFYEKEKINDVFLYIIHIYDSRFFSKNNKIGFSPISEKYVSDIRKNRGKLVLILHLEGYSGGEYNNDLEILNRWIDREEIPPNNVYYISGNLLIDKVAKSVGYEFNCIPVVSLDSWIPEDYVKSREITKFNPIDDKYLYLTYNRNPRRHRVLLLAMLLKRGLFNRGLISLDRFYSEDNPDNDLPIKDLSEKTPIIIDRQLSTNWASNINKDDYEKTFVSLVTESLVDESVLFLSEKIWKPIAVGHPFIVFGCKGSLSYLKNLGFKTFDNWFDESYDEEIDETIRAEKIINEIEKLNNYTIDELREIRKEMTNTLIYNTNHFYLIMKQKYGFDTKKYNPNMNIINILKEIYNGFKK